MTERTTPKGAVRRRDFLAGAAAASTLLVIRPGGAQAAYPEQPITVVVMYSAGGGTDVIMRKLADEMSKATGWTINVVNRPGAVGGVATNYVMSRPSDGYTVLGGANYNKYVRVMGHVPADHVPWDNWHFFHAGSSLASWSVRPESPYKTLNDVIEDAKANPGKISISTSGTGGLWHEMALIVGTYADVELKYVAYKGGQPATLAGLQGETDIAGGGVHEHIELLRAGKLRCLQQTGAEDIKLKDGTVLPSIGNFIPEMKSLLPVGGTYNFMVKRDVDEAIVKQLKDAFMKAANSDGFKEMIEQKHFLYEVVTGADADRRAALMESVTVDIFNKNKDQIGQPVKSAEELGLPKPSEFDQWWPPKGYKAPSI